MCRQGVSKGLRVLEELVLDFSAAVFKGHIFLHCSGNFPLVHEVL